MPHWLIFSLLWQIPDKGTLRRRGLILSQSLRVQAIAMWKAQLPEWEAGAGHCCRRQEAQRDKGWCITSSLLFIQSGTPAHGMVPHTCRMELSTSINPNQDPPKRTRLDVCLLGNSRPCEVGR